MKRAWRLRAQGGRYYAEYTTDDGENWTSTPPGGLASATAAAQFVVEMKRKEEGEEALTEDEKLALMEKFADREAELHDDMVNLDAERAQRLLEYGLWLYDHGKIGEGVVYGRKGNDDEGHLRGDVAS